MSNMYGKDKFHDRQKAVLQKSAQKIENDSGWSQDNFLRGYAEEILPASGAELSFGELCAIGEQVEQETAFSAKEAMRNKIKARRDMPSSKIDEEAASRLKQITGGDSINVPRKFRDDALLERRIKFVFSSNHPIIIDGEDDALLKRIIYLPFNYAIPDDQQDPDLGDKIWKERDAIVTKALHYARKLVQLNYIFPEIPQVDNVKCIVRDSIAKTVGKFIQESCDRSEPKAVTATEDLYNAYSDYCKEKNMWACSKKAFTQELTQRGIKHPRFRCIGEDMIARKNPVSAFQGIKPRP